MSDKEKDDDAELTGQAIPESVETEPRLISQTPGPWKVDPHCTTMIWTVGNPYGKGQMRIADIRGWGHLTGQGACRFSEDKAAAIQDANAHLIAAAPELYEALTAVMAQFDTGYFVRNIESDGQPDWAIKAARSVRTLASAVQALAKAEGRS